MCHSAVRIAPQHSNAMRNCLGYQRISILSHYLLKCLFGVHYLDIRERHCKLLYLRIFQPGIHEHSFDFRVHFPGDVEQHCAVLSAGETYVHAVYAVVPHPLANALFCAGYLQVKRECLQLL